MNIKNLLLPFPVFISFWKYKGLILELAKREVIGRYRGSVFGLAWSFFNPLIMLSVYTFVFSIVFQAKWQLSEVSNKVDFAVIIFAGMIIHSLFSECLNRAPTLIISNANFVKKVIFPLDVLPWVIMAGAFFHFVISLVILVSVQYFLNGQFSPYIILLPLIILPLLFVALGLTWFLSSLGVYVKDISQMVGVITTILMFLSPIFFPITAIPEKYRYLLMLNPLTLFIEETRNVVLFAIMPNWVSIIKAYIISIFVMSSGYYWFQKTRGGFADAL